MGVMDRSELGVAGVDTVIGGTEGPGEKRLFLSAKLNSCFQRNIEWKQLVNKSTDTHARFLKSQL